MDVDISVFACLQLVSCHKKLAVKLFIQLIEDQAALRSYKGAVCVGIAFVANVADGLALRIHVIHHMDKIKFIVAVIAVAFCHSRVHCLKSAFYDIVHLLDRDPFFVQ